MNPEDTSPNDIRTRALAALRTANAAADPFVDRLLLKLVASGWTTAWLIAWSLLCVAAGFVAGVW